MTKKRNFKTAYEHHFDATTEKIKDISLAAANIPVSAIYEKGYAGKYTLPYNGIIDLINKGSDLYYVVSTDCHYDHGGHKYHTSSFASLLIAKTKKSVKEYVMRGRKPARGYGDGRCINCVMEVSKMHPYEIAKMLNIALPYENRLDADKWYASYRKDYPGVMNPACIEEMCREYEKKYGESVDAWKSRFA